MPLGAALENREITTQDRATALSMDALLCDVLAVGTNLAFGKLADFDLRAAMLFGGGLCALGMLALREAWRGNGAPDLMVSRASRS